MIKVYCDKSNCEIRVKGTSNNVARECANIMLWVTERIKRADVPMREALYAMADFAAELYEKNQQVENIEEG